MPITPAEPPERSVESAQRALRDIRGKGSRRDVFGANAEAWDLTAPHPVFVIGLSDLRKQTDLAKAKPAAWEYLVAVNNRVVAAAETADRDLKYRFTQIDEGVLPGAIQRAVQFAESVIDESDYEFRILRIPALYSVNVWLHGAHKDRFVPVSPAPAGLMENRIYGFDELFTILGRLAANRQEDEAEEGNDEAKGG